jgi:metal transporter CNNM
MMNDMQRHDYAIGSNKNNDDISDDDNDVIPLPCNQRRNHSHQGRRPLLLLPVFCLVFLLGMLIGIVVIVFLSLFIGRQNDIPLFLQQNFSPVISSTVTSPPHHHHHVYTSTNNKKRERMMLQQRTKTITTTTAATLNHDDAKQNDSDSYSTKTITLNVMGVGLCLSIAAIAAGLTLGMLGIDPLFLLIKQRASTTSLSEKQIASQLYAIVQHKHLLLVTLLLCNAMANEALPLFLEQLVSPMLAVILSVTFVLFFGEIIPSAIFTGPRQLLIAHSCIPFVQCMMCLFYPIAKPIALLLDHVLHPHDDQDDNDENHTNSSSNPKPSTLSTSASYTRGELAALIRIQYEDRLARKRKIKQQKQNLLSSSLLSSSKSTTVIPTTSTNRPNLIGAIDFSSRSLLLNATNDRQSIRALMNRNSIRGTTVPIQDHLVTPAGSNRQLLLHHTKSNDTVIDEEQPLISKVTSTTTSTTNYDGTSNRDNDTQWYDQTIHHDEIMMMEGALQMQTTVALDVYTAKRRVYSIPYDMILNEHNMVQIYASGYTRIPVHLPNNKNAIVGILVTKYLIVVNPRDNRCVNTIPLRLPRCVSPSMPLVDILNMFQLGGKAAYGGGHLALVCAQPSIGERIFYETSRQSVWGSSGDNHSIVDAPNNTSVQSSIPMLDNSNNTTDINKWLKVLPEEAGYMGIITLEDVLEMLLQEHIYDEMDKVEQNALRIIVKFIRRWRRKHKQRLLQRQEQERQNVTI